MKLKIIYIPKGRAKEYAPLGCSLFTGCPYGCVYCSVPHTKRMTREEYHGTCNLIQEKYLLNLREDLRKLDLLSSKDNDYSTKEILLSFSCDPYPTDPVLRSFTRKALEIIGEEGFRATVLTKAGSKAVADFDILERYNWRFGTTLAFVNDTLRKQYEPGAASCADRIAAIRQAKARGVRTWLSMEPVIIPEEALATITELIDDIDDWRVGKWNHDKEADDIDWLDFFNKAWVLLEGKNVYWKNDLLKAVGIAREDLQYYKV